MREVLCIRKSSDICHTDERRHVGHARCECLSSICERIRIGLVDTVTYEGESWWLSVINMKVILGNHIRHHLNVHCSTIQNNLINY